MKPFINLSDLTDYKEESKDRFKEKYAGISEKIGAKKTQL